MRQKAVQFFDETEAISASKLPKERRRFTYWDLIAFAALFAKEQQTKSLQEFNNYLLDLYADRDSYSRGKLLDLARDKAEELFGGE